MAGDGAGAVVRKRLRARRVERDLHPGVGRAPRSAVSLFHVCDGQARRRSAQPRLAGRAQTAGVLRTLAVAQPWQLDAVTPVRVAMAASTSTRRSQLRLLA